MADACLNLLDLLLAPDTSPELEVAVARGEALLMQMDPLQMAQLHAIGHTLHGSCLRA
jgi:hypothetical protein